MLPMSPHNPSIGALQGGTDIRRAAAAAGAVLVLLATLLFIAVTPHSAEARSYTMPKVDIQAQLETDGSLHVIEQRTFEFDGDYTKLHWTFAQLPTNAEVKANGVRVINLDELDAFEGDSGNSDEANAPEVESVTNSVAFDGVIAGESASDGSPSSNLEGVTTTLEEWSFDLAWREKTATPDADCYSVDSPQNTVYVFFKETPHRIVVELDYTITEMAQVYDDYAEIYWQYLNSGWSQSSENITCELELPLPKGTTVTEGDNVKVWGHGPSGGTVDVAESGLITSEIPSTKLGEYAELRVLVPKTWLTNVSQKALKEHSGTLRGDAVTKDESTWTDKSKSQYLQDLYRGIAIVSICVLILAASIFLYRRYGVEFEPDFKGKYYREIPSPEVHPAVIGRLWRWNERNAKDLTAAILHLAEIGYIRIDREDSKKFQSPAYAFTRQVEIDDVENVIDKETLQLLFTVIAQGNDSLSLASIRSFAKQNPVSLDGVVNTWHAMLTKEVDKEGFFDKRSQSISTIVAYCDFALLGISGILFFFAHVMSALCFACIVVTLICSLVIAHFTRRRTHKGNNLVARCKAFRNWLRDFGKLDEVVPDDPGTWGKFMVYAYQFDVAGKAADQLRIARPSMFKANPAAAAATVTLPCWLSAADGIDLLSDISGVGDAMTSSIEGACSDASSAISGDGGFFGGDFGGGDFGGGDCG